jgi:transposase
MDWTDDEASLKAAYLAEKRAEAKPRLHLLWLVCQGRQIKEAAKLVGVNVRTAQDWINWYRQGGKEAVIQHRRGGYGQPRRLTPDQEAQIVEKAREDGFISAPDAARFVLEKFGVTYTASGMDTVLNRLKLRKKVPRPRKAKASEETQEGFKKGD